jgi:chromosome partitioning protein
MPKCRIITIANQKGGVGKTTTVMNLGHALARSGAKVLLIDSDAQANLTSYLGVTPEHTLDELYLSKKPLTAEFIRSFVHSTSSGVSLIPSDGALGGVEYYLFSRPHREEILKQAIAMIAEDYDHILIDTPPSLNLLTLNALVASHGVVIPVQPEFFSLEGIVKIRDSISDIRSRWNPELEISGILITQANLRRKLTGEVISTLRQEFEDRVFNTVIHENTAVSESSGHAKSVIDYDPRSKGALDYLALGEEIRQKVQSRGARA